MNAQRIAFAWLALVLLAGCTQLEQIFRAPSTPEAAVAQGYALVESINNTIAIRAASPVLTTEQLQRYRNWSQRVDKLHADVKQADSLLAAGRAADADTLLDVTIAALLALEGETKQ